MTQHAPGPGDGASREAGDALEADALDDLLRRAAPRAPDDAAARALARLAPDAVARELRDGELAAAARRALMPSGLVALTGLLALVVSLHLPAGRGRRAHDLHGAPAAHGAPGRPAGGLPFSDPLHVRREAARFALPIPIEER